MILCHLGRAFLAEGFWYVIYMLFLKFEKIGIPNPSILQHGNEANVFEVDVIGKVNTEKTKIFPSISKE